MSATRLLIDVGNTRLKWAFSDHQGLVPGETIMASPRLNKGLLKRYWGALEKPEAVILSSVAAPRVTAGVVEWLAQQWDLFPQQVQATQRQCGVINGYHKPEQLGADRWAALIAARQLFQGNLCVIDCGTAVTLDLLAKAGEHRGGLILPGLQMMHNALVRDTAGIQNGGVAQAEDGLMARCTSAGIEAGTLYMLVAALDRIRADVTASLGSECRFVLTGGDAGRIAELISFTAEVAPWLVLQGLDIMAGGQGNVLQGDAAVA